METLEERVAKVENQLNAIAFVVAQAQTQFERVKHTKTYRFLAWLVKP